MKSIILAAGMGTRLRPLTSDMPKCLIGFEGKTLIDNYFNAFRECGIKEAVVVVGYLSEMIEKKLGDKYRGVKVKFIHNRDFASSNSAYSLWLAKGEISENAFILADSDILFDRQILKNLVNSHHENCLVVDPFCVDTGEEVKVTGESGIVKHLGKIISNHSKAIGESLGLYKFSEKVSNLLLEGTEKYLAIHGKTVEYEDALDSVLSRFKMHYITTQNLRWVDVDTPEDLQKANTLAANLLRPDERLIA